MKLFRSVLFWTHLTAGALASVVILVMSFTGVVLALKPQIQDWIERDVRYVTPQGSPRLSAHALLTAVKAAKPEASPQTLALASDPAAAATVNLGREGNVYVNPYTGAILGHRFGANDPVLPVDDELAPVHGRHRRVPGDGPIGHGNQQSRVPGSGGDGAVHLVAEAVHAPAPEADRVVPADGDGTGARFQLAQHHRVLVPDPDRDHDGQRRRHLVPVGEQSGLSPDRFAGAGRPGRRPQGGPAAASENRGGRGRGGEQARSGRTRRRTSASRRTGRTKPEQQSVHGPTGAPPDGRARSRRWTARGAGDHPGRARSDLGPRRAAGADLESPVDAAAESGGWAGRVHHHRRSELERLCPLESHAQRRHRRRHPVAALRGRHSRTEGARVAALCAHRRARRAHRTDHCRPRLSWRCLSGLHGLVARVPPVVELVALEASRIVQATSAWRADECAGFRQLRAKRSRRALASGSVRAADEDGTGEGREPCPWE